jgi:cytochrome P450
VTRSVDEPDRFDIRRSPNRHLGFGTGIHACLGGPLATMQAEVAFTSLTRRLVEPRVEADAHRYRDDVFHSLAELPIAFEAVRAVD